MSMLTLSPIALVCLISLGIVALLLLVYYFGLFGPFVFRKEKSRTSNEDLPPISIVITAHNEAHHLVESLPVILTQEYPDYEVVLVNDNSQDEIEQLALELNNRYHHLHYVNMGSSRSTMEGRKFPFAIGIQAASNPTVVFTNSSCIPSSPFWLQHIASKFVRQKEVVLAHTTYQSRGGLLNKWLHYDALVNSVRAFSYTLAKMPVLADSHNLAFKRHLFFDNKEKFFALSRLPFGEDNIFINQVANGKMCDVAVDPEAVIYQTPISFSDWLRNKRYELVSQSYYRALHRFVLQCYNWLSFLFYPAAIASIALAALEMNWLALGIGIGVTLLKFGMQFMVFHKGAKKMGEKGAAVSMLFFDLFFLLLQPWIYLASKFEKSRWI